MTCCGDFCRWAFDQPCGYSVGRLSGGRFSTMSIVSPLAMVPRFTRSTTCHSPPVTGDVHECHRGGRSAPGTGTPSTPGCSGYRGDSRASAEPELSFKILRPPRIFRMTRTGTVDASVTPIGTTSSTPSARLRRPYRKRTVTVSWGSIVIPGRALRLSMAASGDRDSSSLRMSR